MSVLLLLYGIETPEADAPPVPPTPTPEVGSGRGPISGGSLARRRKIPMITFNRRIERDDEEVILIGDL